MSLNGVPNGKGARNSRGSKGGKAKGKQQNTTSCSKEDCLQDPYKFDIEEGSKSPCLDKPFSSDEGFESTCRKRMFAYDDDDVESSSSPPGDGAMSGDLQNLLGAIGSDIKKKMDSKRKKVENLTQATVAATSKRSCQLFQKQQNERQKIIEEFVSKTSQIQQKWQSENQKMREQEDKFYEVVKQHEKDIQRYRVSQMESMKLLKQLHEQFKKSIEDLDKVHSQQQTSVQGENKKEMALLQKKLLMETQSQGISNVRQSLQSMLAQV